jgi:hypothetical protein
MRSGPGKSTFSGGTFFNWQNVLHAEHTHPAVPCPRTPRIIPWIDGFLIGFLSVVVFPMPS